MRKILVVFALIISCAVFAQSKKLNLDAGLEVGIPMGDFADVAGVGFGISSKAYYDYSKKMDITARVGYNYFSGKDFGGFDYSYSMIPIMFGAKYHFMENKPELYGSLEAGFNVVIWSWDYEYTIWGETISGDESDSSTEFTIAPSIGYIFKTGEHTFDINASMRMVDMGDLNYIGLRVGYYLPMTF